MTTKKYNEKRNTNINKSRSYYIKYSNYNTPLSKSSGNRGNETITKNNKRN